MIWTLYGPWWGLRVTAYIWGIRRKWHGTHICLHGRKVLSVESAEYFPNVGFVLRNVVGVDEDVVQIYDDYDVDHICENVFINLWKVAGALVSLQALPTTRMKHNNVWNAVFHLSPGESVQGGTCADLPSLMLTSVPPCTDFTWRQMEDCIPNMLWFIRVVGNAWRAY